MTMITTQRANTLDVAADLLDAFRDRGSQLERTGLQGLAEFLRGAAGNRAGAVRITVERV